ncbi:unnamed protein product [Aphanomyces euteiches]|uniref:PPPDE domain-containing protein n=1 Tax=Aphanomyces euteiches TaxID=100861 RepID=A0A6G0XPY1_9STRA|nr:hypothetical protein Ae201684_002601 [Aphanomyces euteiches]KAH9092632.1 hypothetical protein Ae201684P_008303 [Aphanomyces euteiches]
MKGKTTVTLNVYDIVESNAYTYAWGLGAFHSGIVIGGVEFSFAGGAGIFSSEPKQAQGAIFRESIEMGEFEGTYQDAKRIIDDMRSEFQGDHYNLLTRNCNTFSNEACIRLVGQPIPAFVNRIAYFGSCFSCLIPKQLMGDAPVPASETKFAGFSKTASYGSTSVPVFAGEGLSLTAPTTRLLDSTDDDEASRRERRVAAALKRLES